MLRYYWRWIETAFRHSFGRAEAIATFVGLWIPPLVKLLLGRDISMSTELAFQLMAGIATTIVVVRLVLAPYWMQKEDASIANLDRQERDALAKQIKERESGGRIDEAHARVGHVREALLKYASDVPREEGYTHDKAASWVNGADVMLQEAVEQSVSARFLRGRHAPDYGEHRISEAIRILALP